MYGIIVLAVITCLFLLARWFIKAPPEQAKRLLLFISIITLLVVSILFLKFGGILVAAIALAIPIIRKLYALFTTYQYVRKLKTSGQQTDTPASQAMTKKEAQEILGISDHATEAEIKAAYHKLMQKNHPDQGGSEYFAKKLNQARDILLK